MLLARGLIPTFVEFVRLNLGVPVTTHVSQTRNGEIARFMRDAQLVVIRTLDESAREDSEVVEVWTSSQRLREELEGFWNVYLRAIAPEIIGEEDVQESDN
jgi:hypothetical protein